MRWESARVHCSRCRLRRRKSFPPSRKSGICAAFLGFTSNRTGWTQRPVLFFVCARSAEEFHARSARRILIEGYGVMTVGGVAAALNEAVDKIGAVGAELSQCLRDDFRPLNYQFLASQ